MKNPVPSGNLTPEEVVRYNRHLILPEFGYNGQLKLKNARVLLVGTGGLGSPAGMYLAAAGVGTLGLVDFDHVDVSNLQRQVLFGSVDVGHPKIMSAKTRLLGINPHINIETHETRLTSANALEIIGKYDIVADGTDNFPTRYLVNDACVLLQKPNVYGSVFRFEGQASVFWAEKGACYRCLFPQPPPANVVPSCAEGGVLGVLPGLIGVIQATETIKWIVGQGELLVNRLISYDALSLRFKELKLSKDPLCPICSKNPTIKNLIDYEEFCKMAEQFVSNDEQEISAPELKRRIDCGENLQILDVREDYEAAISKIPNSKLIPLGEVVERISEISSHCPTVVYCKGGYRSMQAIEALKQAGFKGELINLSGGILAWSDHVDSATS